MFISGKNSVYEVVEFLLLLFLLFFFFFFKQKTAYEILTCDWSSDVCSSDLPMVFSLGTEGSNG